MGSASWMVSLACALTCVSNAVVPATPDAEPLEVHVLNQAQLTNRAIETLVDEASRIWRDLRELRWLWRSDRCEAHLHVFVRHRHLVRLPPTVPVPGLVPFEHGQPSPFVYLSVGDTRRTLARGSWGHAPFAVLPAHAQEALLGRALGRVLAHELVHYAFASTAHSREGLMRAELTWRDLLADDRPRLTPPDAALEGVAARRKRAAERHGSAGRGADAIAAGTAASPATPARAKER